jgi:hypothetical protein
MNASRTAKEVKKGSTSPIKTPEKSRLPRNSPVTKKPMIRSKLVSLPKKMNHTKSLSQIAYLEVLRQTSVNLVDGFEKIRRITAFSKLRPTFEVLKSLFIHQKEKLSQFVKTKTLFKVLEGLKIHFNCSKNKEILQVLQEIPDFQASAKAEAHWRRKTLEKGLNGMMSYYCSSFELSQLFEDFYQRKLKRKAFEAVFLNSKYDEVVEDFLKVSFI